MPKPRNAAAKKEEDAAKKEGPGRGRRIETAEKATFGVDDKRAQYARLVVFNYGVQEKKIGKNRDVNSATNTELERAGLLLVSGNLLNGKEGIELIQKLTKDGATDEKVAERGLTTAYAQEVRPFLRRLQLADAFGRRSRAKPKEEEGNGEEPAAEEEEEAAVGA
jgi:hypothetical protein